MGGALRRQLGIEGSRSEWRVSDLPGAVELVALPGEGTDGGADIGTGMVV